MEIFVDAMQSYLEGVARRGDGIPPVLQTMGREGECLKFPIIGPEVGRFFAQLAMLRRPRRILELGSGFGYSALWWTVGCPDVHVDCTDDNPDNIAKAMEYARQFGVEKQIHYHEGNALQSARSLKGPWDIIFCDIHKSEYPAALDFALEHLRPGDLLLYDNMLWHGKVGAPEAQWDDYTKGVIETTRRIYDDRQFVASLLPIRDGVLMAIRT